MSVNDLVVLSLYITLGFAGLAFGLTLGSLLFQNLKDAWNDWKRRNP